MYLSVQLIKRNSKSMKLNMFDLNTVCRFNAFNPHMEKMERRVNTPCLVLSSFATWGTGIKQRKHATVLQITLSYRCKIFRHNILGANPCLTPLARCGSSDCDNSSTVKLHRGSAVSRLAFKCRTLGKVFALCESQLPSQWNGHLFSLSIKRPLL